MPSHPLLFLTDSTNECDSQVLFLYAATRVRLGGGEGGGLKFQTAALYMEPKGVPMIRLLTPVLLFASFATVAEECPGFSPVPNAPTKCDLNQLNNNEVADADRVMQNFNTLGDAIDALPTPPTNCTADQIIKWDGSAWVCASRSIVENLCGGDAAVCEALCAEGTAVVSGGCDVRNWGDLGTIMQFQTGPKSDASGWKCSVLYSGSSSYVNAYAICQ